MKKIDKIIIELIKRAQYYNNLAHQSFDSNEYYYYKKQLYVDRAINILRHAKHSHVKFFQKEVPDQNGRPSIISYFQWDGNQMSFHRPLKKFYHNAPQGTKLEWSHIPNEEVMKKISK